MSHPEHRNEPEISESWPLAASFLNSTSERAMSSESVSELPIHYGEVQKDGTRVERPSDELLPRHSSQDDAGPLLPGTATTPGGRHHHGPAIHQEPLSIEGRVRDESRTEHRGGSYSGKADPRRSIRTLEIGRPGHGRSNDRDSYSGRKPRYDNYERYDDYEDDYDESYGYPRRMRDRAYHPEDDYGPPRRRTSRGPARYHPPYPSQERERPRRSVDDYGDRTPQTPRRFNSQRVSHGPSTVQEQTEDGYEDDIYPRDTSPGTNRQLRFKDLSKEERKEVLRLPWIQWMDSEVKNR
jgi:hypothetical protein